MGSRGSSTVPAQGSRRRLIGSSSRNDPGTSAVTPVRRFSDARLAMSLRNISGKSQLTPERGEMPPALRDPETTDPLASLMAKNATPLSAIKTKGLLGDSRGKSRAPGSVLRAAVKGVQNANLFSHQATAIKPPSLSAAVASGDFSLLLEKNEEFFTELTAARTESFASMMQLQENINAKIESVHQQNESLVEQIMELETLVDQERRSWKYMVHDDTESELMEHITKNPMNTSRATSRGGQSFLADQYDEEELMQQMQPTDGVESESNYSSRYDDDIISNA